MKPFTLGPVELTLVALESTRPSRRFLATLAAQVDAGAVRLVDFVIIDRSADGEATVREVDRIEYSLAGLDLCARGLTGYDDLDTLADRVPRASSAAVIAFEPTWSRLLTEQLTESGSVILGAERIPAVVANAILELSTEE